MDESPLRRALLGILNEHRPGHEPGHHQGQAGAGEDTCSCGWRGNDLPQHLADSLETELRQRGFGTHPNRS